MIKIFETFPAHPIIKSMNINMIDMIAYPENIMNKLDKSLEVLSLFTSVPMLLLYCNYAEFPTEYPVCLNTMTLSCERN